jgi:hypothetical protein
MRTHPALKMLKNRHFSRMSDITKAARTARGLANSPTRHHAACSSPLRCEPSGASNSMPNSLSTRLASSCCSRSRSIVAKFLALLNVSGCPSRARQAPAELEAPLLHFGLAGGASTIGGGRLSGWMGGSPLTQSSLLPMRLCT